MPAHMGGEYSPLGASPGRTPGGCSLSTAGNSAPLGRREKRSRPTVERPSLPALELDATWISGERTAEWAALWRRVLTDVLADVGRDSGGCSPYAVERARQRAPPRPTRCVAEVADRTRGLGHRHPPHE